MNGLITLAAWYVQAWVVVVMVDANVHMAVNENAAP